MLSCANGQNLIISGKVIDSGNGNAVQDSVVFINYNYLSYTNKDRYYLIKNLSADKF